MKNKLYNLLKILIGWPLTVAAFFFIVKLILPQANTLLANIYTANPTLLAYGMISFVIFYFIRSYIWHRLIKNLGHDIAFKDSCYMWAVSELKRYIPGNIWSFLGRAVLFSQMGISKKDIGKSLIIEAELFVLGCAIISILSLSFIFLGFQLQFNTPSGLLLTAISIVILTTYIFGKQFLNRHSGRVQNLSGSLRPILKSPVSILNFLLPSYPPGENFLLILLSVIALLFFGLGNYLVIGSFTPLHPQMVLELTGFFVLSFVVGYLSILTPAGFGVREGMIIFGLSKIMSASAAAFAALFSRIILILAEIIFIALSFAWYKLGNFEYRISKSETNTNDKNTKSVLKLKHSNFEFVSYFVLRISNLEKWLSSHIHEAIVVFLASIYSIYFTTISFLRYDNFYTGRFDLGNMVQTVWNTMHGKIFLFTNPNGTDTVSRLAFHADFILIFLAPFYAIWTNPKMLLLIQTMIMAAGAFFVFLIAQHLLKNKNLALVFSFAYLINPSVERANLYDFHAVTLATTFLLATYFFYLKRNYSLFILFAILAAFCKEHLWLIIALFGGLLAIRQKKFLLGSIISLMSIGIFYALVWHAIPNSLGSQHFALSYYSDFGEGPSGVVKSIISSPQKVLNVVLEQSRIDYLKQLFSPLGYLSLLSPLFLIFAGPDLLINLLSNNSNLHQIYYQYTSTITPFIFIAGIWGVWVLKYLSFRAKSRNLIPQNSLFKHSGVRSLHSLHSVGMTILVAYILISSLNAAYKFGPLPGSHNPSLDMIIKPTENREFIDNYLAKIPSIYSISASNNLGSHLSQREKIYIVPLGVEKANMIILLMTDPWSFKVEEDLLKKLKQNPNYELIEEKDKFYVFFRKP